MAQTAAPPAPGTGQAIASNDGITEIIVTANKRAENIQNVPVAVTPLSQDQLATRNIVSIGEVSKIAPSLTFVEAPSPATTMFVIRGVGTFAFNDALEQSVGLVIDGVPMARLVGSISDAVDLGQLQVLRGPQGTLFGKNATAGAIAIDYHEPTFATTFDGHAFYGSYDEVRLQGTLNAPIIKEVVAARVSAWNFTRNGYINAPFQPDGDTGDLHHYGARLKVLIRPNPDWTINLTGEFRHDWDDGAPRVVRGVITNEDSAVAVNPATGAGFGQPISDIERTVAAFNTRLYGAKYGPDNLTSYNNYPEYDLMRQHRAVGKSVYRLGNVDLTAIVGYVDTKTDSVNDTDYTNSSLTAVVPAGSFTFNGVTNTNPLRFTEEGYYHYYSEVEQKTAELRASNSNSAKLRYTLGLFYYDVNVTTGTNSHPPQVLSFTGVASADNSNDVIAFVNTKNYAGFADLSYDLGKLTLFAGGRLSREETSGSFNRDASVEFPTAVVSNGVLHVVSPDIKITDFSYRAGAQWHVTPNVMIYASASKAYKGPGYNYGTTLSAAQFALNGAVVGKETARSYEIGARTQWFDRQLTLNLTGYYEPFTNFQVTTVLPTQPTSFATVNAPELKAKGIELEFLLAPRELAGLTLEGNVVYNDTRFTDFQNAPCYTGQALSATATTTPGICSVRGGARVQSVDGFRAIGSPEWVSNVTLGYKRTVGTTRLFGQLHWFNTSEIQFGLNDDPASIQKGYSTFDLSAGFGPSSRKWTVTGYIRNLTDKRFMARISRANPTINQTVPFTALRSFGASLDVSF